MIDSPLRLMLVDEDPVFRMGLRIWLEQAAGYRVVAEASQTEEALAILADLIGQGPATTENHPPLSPQGETNRALDLVILDLGLGLGTPGQLPGLQLCRGIKTRYPHLPVLVLSAQGEPVLAAAAQQLGADGFGLRSMPVQDLRDWIIHLTGGQSPRPEAPPAPSPSPQPAVPDVTDGPRPTPNQAPRGGAPEGQPRDWAILHPWATLRRQWRRSAFQQIDAMLAALEADREAGRGRTDPWTAAVLAGRYRELRAARWLMATLMATPRLDHPSVGHRPWTEDSWREAPSPRTNPPSPPLAPPGTRPSPPDRVTSSALTTTPNPTLTLDGWPTLIFERVFQTFQGRLDNTSHLPLETDILREEKKRELLYIALRTFEDALEALGRTNPTPGQLADQIAPLLQDVWATTLTDFFGRYSTLPITHREQPVVPTLMAEAEVVQRSILSRIPLMPELLNHLLFQADLVIDGLPYAATTPEALTRSQRLLEHLILQVANGVMQPLLNCFADVELIKKTLYQRRLISSRDIERFRNDLSWRYRWDGLINDPKAIFESQYRLWQFTDQGIQTDTIYAPRRDELDQLSGLQRVVTLSIEARDALAPRVRSAISLIGSGIVYVLTDVVGRGIGLIGRGILRGMGNAWRDPRDRSGGSYRSSENDAEE